MKDQEPMDAGRKAGAGHRRTAQKHEKRNPSRVGAWEWNLHTGEAWYSPGVYDVLGFSPDRCPPELDGFLAAVHPEDREAVERAITTSVEERKSFEVLYRVIGCDRLPRWIESRADVVHGEHGEPVRYIGTMADVTAREETGESLRKRQKQFRDLIEVMPAAIYVTDAKGRITLYNRAAAELWGYRPQLGTDLWCGSRRLYWPDGRPMRHEECPMAIALKERRAIVGEEAVAVRPDGTRVPFLAYPNPLFDASGSVVGAVNMLVDITDRRALEDERALHMREVEALNARLQRAMSETHHRVKNNLQVISAMIDMLVAQGSDSVPSSDVKALSSHIRALAVVHDILTSAAKTNGQADTISVGAVLAKLIPILERASGGRHIEHHIHDVTVPSRTATSLALVANELILNAIKYGRREVRVDFDADDGGALLRVSDDGDGYPPGFDPEHLDTTGIDLVRSLSRWDLRGNVEFRNAETGGALAVVEFPLPGVAAVA